MSTPSLAPDTRTRAPTGGLALGAYCVLLGIVFYIPFTLSGLAQQNDVFMTNLFLGLGAFTIGTALLAVETSRMAALHTLPSIALGLLAAVVAFFGVAASLQTGNYAAAAPLMVAYNAILFALGAMAAARRGYFTAWSRAVLLALVGAAIVTAYYAIFGSRYHDAFGVATYLPHYLDGQTSGLALLLGIAVYVLGRFWMRRA